MAALLAAGYTALTALLASVANIRMDRPRSILGMNIPPCVYTMEELVLPKGYPLEIHTVKTADDYLLSAYRIPHGREGKKSVREDNAGEHGIFDSSACWVLNDPDESLAFIAADAGWDVWMPNSRGNAFSRYHVTLNNEQREYWNFSWGTMAEKDLPAVVDYVLGKSGDDKLAYVGHSQGATQFMAASSWQPELSKKIGVAGLLAPVLSMRRVNTPMYKLLVKIPAETWLAKAGIYTIGQTTLLTTALTQFLCRVSSRTCTSLLVMACGFNENQLNMTRFPDYVKYQPSGTSIYNVEHWMQLLRESHKLDKAVFQAYDRGSVCPSSPPRFPWQPGTCNLWEYPAAGGLVPTYDLSKVNIPLIVFSGDGDKLGVAADTQDAIQQVDQKFILANESIPDYEHLDFTWGIKARYDVYPELLDLLDKYS